MGDSKPTCRFLRWERDAVRFALFGSEYLDREITRLTGQDGLGLGAELRQVAGVLGVQGFLIGHPTHGAVVAREGFWSVSQALVRHGQHEEVECVKLTLASVQAFFQGRDRLGKLASTVEGDTQSVEAHLLSRRQRHGKRRKPGGDNYV
jgi:hypothetical protein